MSRNTSQSVYNTAPVPHQAAAIYSNTPMSQPSSASHHVELSGLYIFGVVSDRSRRTIPTRDNSTAEIVTYTIQDNAGHRYYVDEYSPVSYHEVNSYIEIPVYVKVFQKRNGDISYSFCVQQKLTPSRGEHF